MPSIISPPECASPLFPCVRLLLDVRALKSIDALQMLGGRQQIKEWDSFLWERISAVLWDVKDDGERLLQEGAVTL